MTYPVTPLPSIHQIPASIQKKNQQQTVDQLRAMFAQIPRIILEGVIAFIKEKTGVDLSILLGVLETIQDSIDFVGNLFGGIDFSNPAATVESIWEGVVNAFMLPLNLLLGPNSPINAGNLIGSITHLLTTLPIGAISGDKPNLLPAPTFSADAITGGSGWSVDAGKSRTSDGTGAAKVIADGTSKALTSGRTKSDVIPVSPGQKFAGRIYASHENYVGTGETVQLQVVPFTDGVAGTPERIAGYTPSSADIPWPGQELSGTYVVPDGVTGVQLRILLTSGATAGTFYFDDAKGWQSGGIRQEWIDGLPEALQEAIARWQLLIDTVHNAFTGATSVFNTIEDLAQALLSIPFGNVIGAGGPANIGESVISLINQIVGGLVGQSGEGAGLADVFNYLKQVSSMASQGKFSWEILGIRANKPVDGGLLPSEKSNFPLSNITTELSATQSASLIGLDLIEESMPLGVISWIGYGVSGITEFYVNVWKINLTTGDFSLVHHSPNVVGILSGTASPGAFTSYELATPLAVVAGEAYAYELVPVGGTHTVQGRTSNLPNHPTSQVVALAATRNNTTPNSPPSSIAKASVTRSANVPWIGVAVDTGTGGDHHDPQTIPLIATGTLPIPNWANHVDVIGLGAGGAGHQGATVGLQGTNGTPGKFSAITWHRGDHFTGSSTVITFACGAGGDGGLGNGEDGGDTTVSIPGHTLTAEGGVGGTGVRLGPRIPASGAGDFEYNGEFYRGGVDQNAYGGAGTPSGGAGAGGNWISFQPGGDGANGAAWVRFRKDPVDGEVDSSDTTPPTAPTLSVDSTTFSTLTVTATGATDD